jgi:hypothetical protein
MRAPFCESEGQISLQVKGDSMSPTLECNDIVVISPDGQPGKGDLVAARLRKDGRWSTPIIKRFYPDGNGRIRLKPDNPVHEELVLPADDVRIAGIVVATIRWLDERLSCRDVHMGVRPSSCPMLVSNGMTGARAGQESNPVDYPDDTCMLYPPRPCAFHDPRFDWDRVERMRQRNAQARAEKSEGG